MRLTHDRRSPDKSFNLYQVKIARKYSGTIYFRPVLSIVKSILSFMLLGIFMLHSFSKGIIYLDYQLHKDYIASTLCENKDKPEMHCDGQCHLKKQLEEDDEKDQSPVNSVKQVNEILLFFTELRPALNFENFIKSEEEKFISYLQPISVGHLLSVFRPPCA